MQYKTVSIVMCTYNGGKYLREQLDTILSQTYPLYEIIIQDDGSTDDTIDIIHEYQQHYPSLIKFHRTEGRLGAHLNFKTALVKATGDYVAPADQDDIWLPNKIEILMNAIGDNLLAACCSTIRYANGEEKENFLVPCVVLERMIFGGTLAGHALVYKNTIKEQLWAAEPIHVAFDKMIAMIAAAQSTCVYVPQNLQIWRRHEAVVTSNVINQNIPIASDTYQRGGKLSKFLWSFFCISKNKSGSLTYYFSAVEKLMELLQEDELAKLCRLLKVQTTWSYIRAGVICTKRIDKIAPPPFAKENHKIKIKRWLFVFRYPFTFWQENRLVRRF